MKRLLLAKPVGWLILTGVVAFGVATWTNTRQTSALDEPVGPIKAFDRATVALAPHRVQPVISVDGVVEAGRPKDRWDIVAPITPIDEAYRLLDRPASVRATIRGGPAAFSCEWKGLSRSAEGVSLRCEIPSDVRAVAGLSALVVAAVDPAVSVMSLPATAVLGDAESGRVVVVDGTGSMTVVPVRLGRADGTWVEIKSGLRPRHMVLERPVQSDLVVP